MLSKDKIAIIGSRIKNRRLQYKISQHDLAERVNISNNHLSAIETGKENPSMSTLINICKELNTTPDFFILGALHSNNVPLNIADSLKLCNEKELKIIETLIEALLSNRN